MNPRVGLLSFPPEENQLNKPYSDDTARIIDGEVRTLVDAAYQRTLKVGGPGFGGRGRPPLHPSCCAVAASNACVGSCLNTSLDSVWSVLSGPGAATWWCFNVSPVPSTTNNQPHSHPTPDPTSLQLLEEKKEAVESMAQALLKKEVLGTGEPAAWVTSAAAGGAWPGRLLASSHGRLLFLPASLGSTLHTAN